MGVALSPTPKGKVAASERRSRELPSTARGAPGTPTSQVRSGRVRILQAARLAPPPGGARPEKRILPQGACALAGHVTRSLLNSDRQHLTLGRSCGPGARAQRCAGRAERACAEVSRSGTGRACAEVSGQRRGPGAVRCKPEAWRVGALVTPESGRGR